MEQFFGQKSKDHKKLLFLVTRCLFLDFLPSQVPSLKLRSLTYIFFFLKYDRKFFRNEKTSFYEIRDIGNLSSGLP